MNLVDSCGWMEYFCGTKRANLYAPAIEDLDNLIVPSVCIYEVFKKILIEVGKQEALQAAATMRSARVLPFDETIALSAALISQQFKTPMADSIIIASAKTVDALIWTQDSHFENIPGVKYFPK